MRDQRSENTDHHICIALPSSPPSVLDDFVLWDVLPHCLEEHRKREFSEHCGFKTVVPANEKTIDCTVKLGGSHRQIGENGENGWTEIWPGSRMDT